MSLTSHWTKGSAILARKILPQYPNSHRSSQIFLLHRIRSAKSIRKFVEQKEIPLGHWQNAIRRSENNYNKRAPPVAPIGIIFCCAFSSKIIFRGIFGVTIYIYLYIMPMENSSKQSFFSDRHIYSLSLKNNCSGSCKFTHP